VGPRAGLDTVVKRTDDDDDDDDDIYIYIFEVYE
jgi:hypothetical protein